MTNADPIRLTTPLTEEQVRSLRAGDRALLSGVAYAARDTAHKRLVALLDAGEPPPVPLDGQVIYYAGPSPARSERTCSSVSGVVRRIGSAFVIAQKPSSLPNSGGQTS